MPEPLRVVLAVLYWDYGQKERGLSYEYYNLYLSLKTFCNVQLFDFHTLFLEGGREAMNRGLLNLIKQERPDLAIFAPYQDEFMPDVIAEVKNYTTTLCYSFDDVWRIDYTKRWLPMFHYVTTSSTHCLRRYREWGYHQVIFSPCGYNHLIFRRKDQPKLYDVSFVGGFHGHRHWIIRQLQKAGISVRVWGMGWPEGRLTQEELVDVLNQSRITLTLSNSVSWDARYLVGSPRWALSDLRRCRKFRDQIKGRHFEVAGCGTFQISYYVEDLERCYDLGREIVLYSDIDDLVEKIRYFLKHEDEREAIAAAGHSRALEEHTYVCRFRNIVEHIFRARDAGADGGLRNAAEAR